MTVTLCSQGELASEPELGLGTVPVRTHSGPFYGIEIRRTEFYLAPLLQNVIHIYCTFELSGRAPIFTSIFERSYSEIRTLRGKGGYTGVDIERIPSS